MQMNDKSDVYVGVDIGTDDTNTECLMRKNDDGTLTVLAFNQWKHDIDLKAEKEPGVSLHDAAIS